jgi:NAD(P)-dependent dehydrogenase (short-subunit alcohol dehydrogenase family)
LRIEPPIDVTSNQRLSGRRVFLTGAGSGIGRACALRLAAEGAFVAVSDREPEAAQATTELVPNGVALVADVTSEESVSAAVAEAAEAGGGLDAVVTCAGVLQSAATHETPLELWDLVLDVNLTGTFLAVRACLPHLLAAGGGSVVTVGSIASVVAGGYAACYDASKGAVLQFTRAVGAEYAHRGIRANCVCPGAVTTGLKATSTEVTGPLRSAHATWAEAPMSRHADPAELAAVVAFLCADDSSFMTGSAVMVDGGFTAV